MESEPGPNIFDYTEEPIDSPPQIQKGELELAIPAKGEQTCGDATSPSQTDIQHLVRNWGEVGRAILARRRDKL